MVSPNPFRFGAPVDAAGFCDRTEELATLTGRMASGIHVFLLSPRRYGKTSLVDRALARLRQSGGRGGYANLLLCTTEDEVASVVTTAVVREVLRPAGRARRTLDDVVHHLRLSPTIGVGADGRVSVRFDPALRSPTSWLDALVDAVALLESAAGDGGATLVLDEFQAVAGIGPAGIGGVFKALADMTRHASLVFAGSHLAVMEQLTSGPAAPLLGMGETVRLDVVPERPMTGHLVRRARAAGKELSQPTARHIYRAAGTIPNDVQWLAYAAFEAAGTGPAITDDHVRSGLDAVVRHQAVLFAERYERLAPVQQRIVRALARAPVAKPYAKAFLDLTRVANANAVRGALEALGHQELVRHDQTGWRLTSAFFAAWLAAQEPG